MQTTAPHTESTAKLHTACKTLSIANFKECYCNQNYQVLIIEGEPTEEELIAAWSDIVFEYGCAIKTENSEYLLGLQKSIAELTRHIAYVDDALLLLERKYSQSAIDELIELGYEGIYNFDDHVQYLKQLARVKSLCKTRVMDLIELKEEYKKYNVSTDGAAPTEAAFEEWMGELSRFQHYRIDQQTTMVTEWCGIINSFLKHRKAKQPAPTDG
jgi:hypothetical protein